MATKTPKRLSTAILAGCKVHPQQAYGAYAHFATDTHEIDATCAMGAMIAGLGGDPVRGIFGLPSWALLKTHEVETKRPCPVPDCKRWGWEDKETRVRLNRLIVHLNDYHKWTREEIAEWLRRRKM